jgi:hypothetical protein
MRPLALLSMPVAPPTTERRPHERRPHTTVWHEDSLFCMRFHFIPRPKSTKWTLVVAKSRNTQRTSTSSWCVSFVFRFGVFNWSFFSVSAQTSHPRRCSGFCRCSIPKPDSGSFSQNKESPANELFKIQVAFGASRHSRAPRWPGSGTGAGCLRCSSRPAAAFQPHFSCLLRPSYS